MTGAALKAHVRAHELRAATRIGHETVCQRTRIEQQAGLIDAQQLGGGVMHLHPAFADQMHLAAPRLRFQSVDAAQRTRLKGFGAHGEMGKKGSESVSHGVGVSYAYRYELQS